MKSSFLALIAATCFVAPVLSAETLPGLEDRMMMQCPGVTGLQLSEDNMHIRYKTSADRAAVAQCLQNAYAEVISNRYPVRGDPEGATEFVILKNGVIKLF